MHTAEMYSAGTELEKAIHVNAEDISKKEADSSWAWTPLLSRTPRVQISWHHTIVKLQIKESETKTFVSLVHERTCHKSAKQETISGRLLKGWYFFSLWKPCDKTTFRGGNSINEQQVNNAAL